MEVDSDVSIHALLAECDRKLTVSRTFCQKFQSTHSLRSATKNSSSIGAMPRVSIHALLAECDEKR